MKARHEFNCKEDYEAYLRTYIAAMAMQGLISIQKGAFHYTSLAANAASLADELLKQLESPTP